jgi:phosphoenolpyruvate carboxykinase (ATP)
MDKISKPEVSAKKIHINPSPDTLKQWALEMPSSGLSEFNNPNTKTKVLSRSSKSTFVVCEDPTQSSHSSITSQTFDALSQYQNEYIADKEMILIEGYIGQNPKTNTATRLFIEKSYANIAGMQQILYFTNEGRNYESQLTVIYTPGLLPPPMPDGKDYPDKRLIAVDLENKVTRVFNSDYFGESKKGGLRMWNKLIFDLGGLPMHAGAKIIPVGEERKSVLIVGLSGTGKTTTTFSSQNNSQPVQDDFVALMPNGDVLDSENGCFAKTFAIEPAFEPEIYNALIKEQSYLENAPMQEKGKIDFADASYTKNGRAVFAMSGIENAAAATDMEKASILLILNRNETIIPGVVRLNKEQAAAYFMLGETQGTSAGGKDEEGKSLRIPGTNPFFPLPHALQGNRFLELLENVDLEVYLLNTGMVAGHKKVKIPHSSAFVKAIAEGSIKWQKDEDFGYEVATEVPGIEAEDFGLLQPKTIYEAEGRLEEYQKIVKTFKEDRKAYMLSWPGIDERLIQAVS